MLKRFEIELPLFEKTEEGEFPTDGRVSFIFLPGDEEVLIDFREQGDKMENRTLNHIR